MSIRVSVTGGGLTDRADQAARKATEAVMREVFAAFQQSFTAKAWDWPQPTVRLKRKRGKPVVAESPRNIIDIDNLRQTGTYSMTGPYSARFTWSANYAAAVHEGYRRFKADGSYSSWPARPWTSAVLGRVQVPGIAPFPIEKRLKETWTAYFRSANR